MARRIKEPPEVAELVEMLECLKREGDRGAALISAAWVDDALATLLRSRFVDDRQVVDSLLLGDALGSFSAKIKLAYCLGFIGKDLMGDMNVVREIRNEFAHWRRELTFGDESIGARCNNLKTGETLCRFSGLRFPSVRDRFLICAVHMVRFLLLLTEKTRHLPNRMDDAYGLFLKKMGEKAMMQHFESILEQAEREAGDETAGQ